MTSSNRPAGGKNIGGASVGAAPKTETKAEARNGTPKNAKPEAETGNGTQKKSKTGTPQQGPNSTFRTVVQSAQVPFVACRTSGDKMEDEND